jgi:hypothetical protein
MAKKMRTKRRKGKQNNNVSGRTGVHRQNYVMHRTDKRYGDYEQHVDVWVASWVENGVRKQKRFSVKQYGSVQARKLAIAYRRKMEAKHYT